MALPNDQCHAPTDFVYFNTATGTFRNNAVPPLSAGVSSFVNGKGNDLWLYSNSLYYYSFSYNEWTTVNLLPLFAPFISALAWDILNDDLVIAVSDTSSYPYQTQPCTVSTAQFPPKGAHCPFAGYLATAPKIHSIAYIQPSNSSFPGFYFLLLPLYLSLFSLPFLLLISISSFFLYLSFPSSPSLVSISSFNLIVPSLPISTFPSSPFLFPPFPGYQLFPLGCYPPSFPTVFPFLSLKHFQLPSPLFPLPSFSFTFPFP